MRAAYQLQELGRLEKDTENGGNNTGEVQACRTCRLGKSDQQVKLKHATYDVRRPSELVRVDTIRPITIKALCGYRYTVTLVNQLTKLKKIIHINDKTNTVEALATYN